MRACEKAPFGWSGANLGHTGQSRRLQLAAVVLAVALGLSVWAVQADASRWMRALLFVPFLFAAFGAVQGLYRTCPMHARNGMRETESGEEERVAKKEDLAAGKRLGRHVMAGSFATALLATAFVVLIP